jgi:hypothetical protein
MTNKSTLKWIFKALVGAAALLGFMMAGQYAILLPIIIIRFVFPSSALASTPFVMQIGGAVGIAIAVFLAYWKRLLSVPQLFVSLIFYDVIMVAYQYLLFPTYMGLFDLIFNLEFLIRFNALTLLPWLIGVGAAVGLRSLKRYS